jgi:tetratricopeptide (TPR) repeat protein
MRVRARRRFAAGLRFPRALGLALWLGLALAWVPARADPPAAGAETATPPEAAEAARQHFQKGRELYQKGAYREAIAELEAARKLDPRAKDLVYNLGVVNERLGQIEDALRYFHLYVQMDVTAAERARAETYLRRLEGAKHEIVPVPTSTATAPPPPPPPPEEPRPGPKGRIDAATIVAATVAVAGVGVGVAFGIKAMQDQPPSSFVTGRDGTYADLQSRTTTAHREAIVADVGFGVGLAAALVTAYLYFARPKQQPAPTTGAAISWAPVAGGGALLVSGSF